MGSGGVEVVCRNGFDLSSLDVWCWVSISTKICSHVGLAQWVYVRPVCVRRADGYLFSGCHVTKVFPSSKLVTATRSDNDEWDFQSVEILQQS